MKKIFILSIYLFFSQLMVIDVYAQDPGYDTYPHIFCVDGDCMEDELYESLYDGYFPDFPGIELSENIINKIPGEYLLESHYDDTYNEIKDVKALLYIPTNLDINLPSSMVVFYHGMTSDKDYYKNISNLKTWAEKYKFMVLSVQNYWSLNYYTQGTSEEIGQMDGTIGSLYGAININTSLIKTGIVDRDLVFVTGFSAGGIPAQAAVGAYPEFFRGLGNFSGNFYSYDVEMFFGQYADKLFIFPWYYEEIGRPQEELLVMFSYGGVNETARIKEQMPQALEVFGWQGIPVNYFEHNSGHAMTQSGVDYFVKNVIEKAIEQDLTRDKENLFKRDVESSIYSDAIFELNEKGIIEGYDDGSFRPWKSINRAEFTKIVIDAIDAEISSKKCFPDVEFQWFSGYVCAAKKLGAITGYADGLFHPEKNINIVEALKIVFELYDIELEDAKEGEDWYQPYIDYANENDLYLPTFSSANDMLTREDLAEIIKRLAD